MTAHSFCLQIQGVSKIFFFLENIEYFDFHTLPALGVIVSYFFCVFANLKISADLGDSCKGFLNIVRKKVKTVVLERLVWARLYLKVVTPLLLSRPTTRGFLYVFITPFLFRVADRTTLLRTSFKFLPRPTCIHTVKVCKNLVQRYVFLISVSTFNFT